MGGGQVLRCTRQQTLWPCTYLLTMAVPGRWTLSIFSSSFVVELLEYICLQGRNLWTQKHIHGTKSTWKDLQQCTSLPHNRLCICSCAMWKSILKSHKCEWFELIFFLFSFPQKTIFMGFFYLFLLFLVWCVVSALSHVGLWSEIDDPGSHPKQLMQVPTFGF